MTFADILTFNKRYCLLSVSLFLLEVMIALYMHDRIIRPYAGDYLVVILLYCSVKTFLSTPPRSTAVAILLFAYTVEILQYYHVVNLLKLEDHVWARVMIGTNFEWVDLIAYTLGVLSIIALERR